MSHDGADAQAQILGRLVYKLNQIGGFFATQANTDAAAEVARHVRDFWDPRMRAQIYAHLDHGGDGLTSLSRAALIRLRPEDRPPAA